jgi:hypothetical protein
MAKPAFRRAFVALAAAGAIAGCDSAAVRAAHSAERRAAIIEHSHGSADDNCAARREVAAAWLLAEDQGKYDMAKLEADIACNAAALEHLRD